MPLEECEQLWEANEGVDHPDVSLHHDWHLNFARVPIPPVPKEEPIWMRRYPAASKTSTSRWYDFLA
jgi:hypothetical protein